MKRYIMILLLLIICTCKNTYALTTLNEVSNKRIINSGTSQITYKKLTDKGWLNINIVEVNLKDSNTNVTVLTSSKGLSTLQNVKSMFEDNKNIIASINADFYNGKTNKGNIVGMTIKDGKMLTSTYYENEVKNTLASFVLDKNGNAEFDYFSNTITLTNLKSDIKLPISEINKWSSNYEYPVIYTPEWGNSIGNTLGIEITELVIKDNKVSDIRINKDPIKIPTNGYVVSCIGEAADIIQKSFTKKSKVKLDVDINLDINKVKTAISGGTLLVNNGEIAEFTHNIAGVQPRSVIGLSKDKKILYLITIDGRQDISVGVTQTELAEILIEKGIYTAMNLDGGGSTTLVTRRLGETDSTIENNPSDQTLRNVPNALAITNTSKTSSLYKLNIEIEDNNVYENDEVKIKIRGYDKYFNPIDISKRKIKWTYEGAKVNVDKDVIKIGDEVGIAKLKASIGAISETFELNIHPSDKRLLENDICLEDLDIEDDKFLKLIITPSISKPRVLLDNLKNKKLEDIIVKENAIGVLTLKQEENINSSMIIPNEYTSQKLEYVTIITLDVLNGGLRKTDFNQWQKLKEDIEKADKNIIIVLNGNLENFEDEEEKKLFKKVLEDFKNQEEKNIFVIENGEEYKYTIDKGIRYLKLSEFYYDSSKDISQLENANYIEMIINESNITYKIKNIFK